MLSRYGKPSRSYSPFNADNSTGSSRYIDPLAYTTFQRQINRSTSEDQNTSNYLQTDATEHSEFARPLTKEHEVLLPQLIQRFAKKKSKTRKHTQLIQQLSIDTVRGTISEVN